MSVSTIFSSVPISTHHVHDGKDPAGALTTIFEFSETCGPMVGDPWSQDLDCALPNWDTYTGSSQFWHMHFYSPAICPEGYRVACTRPVNGLLGPPVEATEEAWICLPSGYICDPSRTMYGTSAGVTSLGLISDNPELVAPYVQIRWAESDLEILETHPLTPGLRHAEATTAGTPLSLPETTGSSSQEGDGDGGDVEGEPNTESDNTESGGGLSKAAQAGIGVGVSVGVLLIVMISVLVWRRYRKKNMHAPEPEAQLPVAEPKDPYVWSPNDQSGAKSPPPPSGVHELHTGEDPGERFELPSHPVSLMPGTEIPIDSQGNLTAKSETNGLSQHPIEAAAEPMEKGVKKAPTVLVEAP